MLKMDDNNQCHGPAILKQYVVAFYEEHYETVGPRNFDPIIDKCPCLARDVMNVDLIAPVMVEKVKVATF